MDINITLFLQMVQFGCAYVFLYRYIFAPAYKILDEKEQLKYALYKNLEYRQQMKDTLLQEFNEKNSLSKAMLRQTIPEQATQLIDQKIGANSTLYCVEKVDVSSQDSKKAELFLVDHLSQVVKK